LDPRGVDKRKAEKGLKGQTIVGRGGTPIKEKSAGFTSGHTIVIMGILPEKSKGGGLKGSRVLKPKTRSQFTDNSAC